MQQLPVSKIMNPHLITVNRNESVAKVAAIFKEHAFHHLPVIDEQGCLEGIISLTDIERLKMGATFFRNPQKESYTQTLFENMRVCEMMIKDIVQLQPADSIRRAYVIFKENKFRALPIVDKGKLVGIVTPLDLLNYFFSQEYAEAKS